MARQQKISLFGQFSGPGADQTSGTNLRALAGLSEEVGNIAFQLCSKA